MATSMKSTRTTPCGSRSWRAHRSNWVVLSGQKLDVVHAHDWQAGLTPVYLATTYRDHPAFAGTATVFTIHNLAYQGLFPADVLADLDLGPELYAVNGLEYWSSVSFLKGGINFSDAITTVSPRYATEILTPDLDSGLMAFSRAGEATSTEFSTGSTRRRGIPRRTHGCRRRTPHESQTARKPRSGRSLIAVDSLQEATLSTTR